MSYRSFKRLFGETSLERKCRLLLGGGIFALVCGAFFFYGYQTEKLVWDQTELTAKLLVNPILMQRHWPDDQPLTEEQATGVALGLMTHPLAAAAAVRDAFASELTPESEQPLDQRLAALAALDDLSDALHPEVQTMREYRARLIRPGPDPPPGQAPFSPWEVEVLADMAADRRDDARRPAGPPTEADQSFQYLTAIRMRPSCMACHPTAADRRAGHDSWQAGELMAALSIELPLDAVRTAVNVNRAILLSFAIGTAALAMLFLYVVIRYVMVRPVQHLKEVADEIASGNMAVRSDIQTGDEFQGLSQAFNRMLRSVMAMQDELRKVNGDLDEKLDELARANMSLFEMNRLKSDFLATISHELRTPLNSILGFSDLLAETTGEGPQRKWVGNIQSSGKLLLDMINDILDLAKLEAGKMDLHLEDFSLRDTVEGVAAMLRPMADRKLIVLDSEVDPNIPILHSDGGKLQQILVNLTGNAIKFTPEGGHVRIVCRQDRAHVDVAVHDNGVGIAPEDQQAIFDKFRQAEIGPEGSLTRHHGGTGLGLSIVKELTKLLGGDEVRLDSELGRGSTFRIRIPMRLTPRPTTDLTIAADGFDESRTGSGEVRYFNSTHSTAPTRDLP